VALNYFSVTGAITSAIPLCSGTVKTMHGAIPAMSPAASLLLKGQRFYQSEVIDELITPTAAAVIALLTDHGKMDVGGFSYDKIGSGAGTKEFDSHANIMRIFLGNAALTEDLIMIETNIDDMSPQLFEPLFEALFACDGVLDAFTTPVMMKKSRPGFLLNVLIKGGRLDAVSRVIFENSTTIGMRYSYVDRVTLDRSIEKIDSEFGEFSIKIARSADKIVNVSLEYDEVKSSAKRLNMSVKELMERLNTQIEEKFLNNND
ncbi:LarC family nickel insertion protein, partial [Thermodesulfobacteriota bacterium]